MIVVWRITERCNLSCPFCAYDRNKERTRRDADASLIRRFGAVLAEYQNTTGDRVLVSWLGGEPFLFPRLQELTTFFVRELRLSVSTTTNGTSLGSSKVREHILHYYTELTISADGVGSIHNQLRGWPDGFQALREAVVKLAETKRRNGRGPRLRANIVLMRQTRAGFAQLCAELAGWGIEEITFNPLGGRDRPEFYPAHRLLAEDADWLTSHIPPLRRHLAERGVRLNGSEQYLRRIRAGSRQEAIPVADCRPGEQFLFVSESGLVSPCHFTTEGYGVPVDELTGALSLQELPQRFARLRTENRLTACEDCQSTRVFEKFTL